MNQSPAEPSSVFRRHHLLALVPLFALLFAPYIANKLEPRILGMPFLLGWIVVWVVLTSVAMFVILRLDGDTVETDAFNGDTSAPAPTANSATGDTQAPRTSAGNNP